MRQVTFTTENLCAKIGTLAMTVEGLRTCIEELEAENALLRGRIDALQQAANDLVRVAPDPI